MRNNNDHPFFRPLWRRVALVVFCAAWTLFEFLTDGGIWVMMAGGMTALGAYQFLYAYKLPPEATGDKEP